MTTNTGYIAINHECEFDIFSLCKEKYLSFDVDKGIRIFTNDVDKYFYISEQINKPNDLDDKDIEVLNSKNEYIFYWIEYNSIYMCELIFKYILKNCSDSLFLSDDFSGYLSEFCCKQI